MTRGRPHSHPTSPPRRVLCLLLALATILGSVGALRRARAEAKDAPSLAAGSALHRSPAIYPPERRTVRFEHRRHGAALGLSCRDCHSRATTSTRAEDLLLPHGVACDRCHGVDHSDALRVIAADEARPVPCATCHALAPDQSDRVLPQRYPRPNLHFDHAVHARRGIGCAQCHGDPTAGAPEGRSALPPMRRCARCHLASGPARGDAPNACTTCHLERAGVLRTTFPTGTLTPPRWLGNARHGPDFAMKHAAAAASDSRFCASCHRESDCASCHDGRVRPRRLHPNDWLTLHGRAADQGAPRCASCHRQQSFCLGCHQRLGLSATTAAWAAAGRGRHHPPPAVWTDPPRSRRHHAWSARRNLGSCVSCHAERDCVSCHATAARGAAGTGIGHGANPHRPGFARSCAVPFRKNPRACWVCHERGAPELERCR